LKFRNKTTRPFAQKNPDSACAFFYIHDMQELFLTYLWKHRLLKPLGLQTTGGSSVTVIYPGIENTDAGPDFLSARVRIGDTVWAGNVEVHVLSSDWYRHGHHRDEAYDNVILHVVHNFDRKCFNSRGQPVPLLVIRDHFDQEILKRYETIEGMSDRMFCRPWLKEADRYWIRHWLGRMLIERLERKAAEMQHFLWFFSNDWEQLFHYFLARNMGGRVNALPFGLLAQAAPFSLILKYRSQPQQLDSLLFGQAGMLDRPFDDPYPGRLRSEYKYLQRKHALTPMQGSLWRFARLRPRNFPTIRIAQLSAMYQKPGRPFRACMEARDTRELRELLQTRAPGYWNTHFRFGKTSPEMPKTLGKGAIDLLMINTIAPMSFVYGKLSGKDLLREKSLGILEEIPPENNRFVRLWQAAGVFPANASDSQAMLEASTRYCHYKKCLHCMIGHHLVKTRPPQASG
jgi:hypothetical protein